MLRLAIQYTCTIINVPKKAGNTSSYCIERTWLIGNQFNSQKHWCHQTTNGQPLWPFLGNDPWEYVPCGLMTNMWKALFGKGVARQDTHCLKSLLWWLETGWQGLVVRLCKNWYLNPFLQRSSNSNTQISTYIWKRRDTRPSLQGLLSCNEWKNFRSYGCKLDCILFCSNTHRSTETSVENDNTYCLVFSSSHPHYCALQHRYAALQVNTFINRLQ